MAKDSKIEWTDHTINLWWGCAKVHAGCKNCYAEFQSDKMKRGLQGGGNLWGENAPRRLIKSAFKDLGKYQEEASKSGKRAKIFVGSMMDIFEDSKPVTTIKKEIVSVFTESGERQAETGDFRTELFDRITAGLYKDLIFLFLTKRPENISKMIPEAWSHGFPNVWFGTSVSNVETIKYAEKLRTSLEFQNLFLSIEPQVGEIKLGDINLKGIDWVIQGGESGSNKRPFDISWAYQMKDICSFYGVPYFFKQIDKIQAIPDDLMIREFPKF